MLSKENTMRFTPGTISSAWTRERYIVSAGPNPLSLLPDHSGRTGVLAERENPLRGDLRVFEEGERHVAVVFGGLGVLENRRHLPEVGFAQHE